VTRNQCELSGRRDSGTALAVVLVYTRSSYVSGHVVVAVASVAVNQQVANRRRSNGQSDVFLRGR
jgi:hypothetical protein